MIAAPPPPLGGEPLLVFLAGATLLLAVAYLLGCLARRAGLPALVGELATGVILGPSLLMHLAPGVMSWFFPARPEQYHLLDAVGQFGVIMLVAVTGMHLDLALIRRRRATAVRVSLPGFVLPLGLGIGLGFLVPVVMLGPHGDRTTFAVFMGVAMSVSAIPVIAKTLMDMQLLHRNIGQLILMSGTVDDILGWTCLSVVTAMATTGVGLGDVGKPVAVVVAFAVAVALIGRPVVRRLMRGVAAREDPGPALMVATIVIFTFAAITHRLGLEAIFGALAAGVVIRAAGADVVAKLAPMRLFVTAVLAPLFFATAGLRMDLTALADPRVLLTAVVVLVVAIVSKFAGAFLGGRLSRLNRYESVALGAGMNSRGVVEVIIAMVGLRLGVLGTEMYTVVVLMAVVTSLMGPPILRASMARLEITEDERLRRAEHDGVPAGGNTAPQTP